MLLDKFSGKFYKIITKKPCSTKQHLTFHIETQSLNCRIFATNYLMFSVLIILFLTTNLV